MSDVILEFNKRLREENQKKRLEIKGEAMNRIWCPECEVKSFHVFEAKGGNIVRCAHCRKELGRMKNDL